MKLYINLFIIASSLIFLSGCKLDDPDFKDPANYVGGTVAVGTTGSTGTTGTTGTTGVTGSTGTTGGTGVVTTGSSDDDSSTPGVYYLKGTLNGAQVDWEERSDGTGWIVGDLALTSPGLDGLETGGIGGLLSTTDSNSASIDIEFGTLHYADNADKTAYFEGFFGNSAISSWSYATNFTDPNVKGISIIYDIGDDSYSTANGSQSSSNFKVLGIEKRPSSVSLSESVKIKVSFSCTLYDVNNKLAPITLTNAESVIRITNDL